MNTKILGIIISIIILLGVGFVIAKTFFSTQKEVIPLKTNENATGLVQTISGDFDRDGKITIEDVNLVKANIGCKKNDECWNKVVGHTKEGDNIMYTSDLDLNNDGVIDEKDIPTIPQ